MRVLFVSNTFPADPRRQVHGVYQRMGMFIDAIKESARLDMLFFVPPGIDTDSASTARFRDTLARHWEADLDLSLCPRTGRPPPTSYWESYGAGVLSLFRQQKYEGTSGPRQVDALERRLEKRPDWVFVHRLTAMCPVLRTRVELPGVWFDLDDLEPATFLRSIEQPPRWPAKRLYYLQVPALSRGVRRAACLAQRTFVCSEADRRRLSERASGARVATVSNAVRIPPASEPSAEPTLLFLGSFAYRANSDAADFLLSKIWPPVRQAVPRARLIIAGPRPEHISALRSAGDGVEVTGFVKDLDELYRRSRVVCSPILSGGGTRFKVIEAAAHGKPLVSTRLGAEGLGMEDGRHLLIRDDAESFAAACVDLLSDPDSCSRLGLAARRFAMEHYDRSSIVARIRTMLPS